MSVSELIWGYFIIKKGVKLRPQTHKNLDFLTMSERIDIKIGGYIERKLCVCFACVSDRLNPIVAGNEKLFFLNYHIYGGK